MSNPPTTKTVSGRLSDAGFAKSRGWRDYRTHGFVVERGEEDGTVMVAYGPPGHGGYTDDDASLAEYMHAEYAKVLRAAGWAVGSAGCWRCLGGLIVSVREG